MGDASGPGIAELQALATCLNGQSAAAVDLTRADMPLITSATMGHRAVLSTVQQALIRGSGFMKQVDLVSTFSAAGNEKLDIIPHQEVCEVCEHVVQYVVDRALQGVCDADAVCGHFHGKWKAHCADLEAALHDSSNAVGRSLCEYVQGAAGGETDVMCTELLQVVAHVRHQEPPDEC